MGCIRQGDQLMNTKDKAREVIGTFLTTYFARK